MKSPRVTLAGLYRKYGEKRINLLARKEFEQEVEKFLADIEYRDVVTPLSDKDVPERFKESVKKWRRLARVLGWNGPVAYLVRAGYNLKEDPKFIQKYGDGEKEFGEPTVSALVFCILLFVPEFVGQTQAAPLNKDLFGLNAQAFTTEQDRWIEVYGTEEQKDLLAKLREQFELPEHHLSGFGSLNTLAAMIQSNYRRTGNKVPPYLYETHYSIRTDIMGIGGLRYIVCLDVNGIAVPRLHPNSGRATIGCLPIGVETLEK